MPFNYTTSSVIVIPATIITFDILNTVIQIQIAAHRAFAFASRFHIYSFTHFSYHVNAIALTILLFTVSIVIPVGRILEIYIPTPTICYIVKLPRIRLVVLSHPSSHKLHSNQNTPKTALKSKLVRGQTFFRYHFSRIGFSTPKSIYET